MAVIEAFVALFDNQEDCDIMFSVDSMTIGAHKAFLQARSKVLYSQAKKWNSKEEPLVIIDLSYDTFRAVLRYIYSDEIDITNENVFHLLFASKSFEMCHLEEKCTKHIIQHLSKESVCEYMKKATELHASSLQQECNKVFAKNTKEILASSEFLALPQTAVSSFLDADEINVLEIDLFMALSKWMAQQCKNQELPEEGVNMRQVIGSALYKIRFPTMTVWDFSNEVTCIEGLLTEAEIAQTFRKISSFKNVDIQCPFPCQFRCFNGVSQDNNLATQCNFYHNSVFLQNGSWCSLASAFGNWYQSRYALDRKSVQLFLQFCGDLRNSSSSESVINTSVDSNSKTQCYNAFTEWNNANANSSKNMQAAMSKLAQLQASLANLP